MYKSPASLAYASCCTPPAVTITEYSTTRLILIRHAHTASNGGSGSVLSGRTDVPLSARGRLELQRLQARLRGSTPFDAIYASPLRRAADTATALEQAGLGAVHRCPGLQEIDCGMLDGMRLDRLQRSYPDLWHANQRQSDSGFRWPGGESYREFRCRCLIAVRTLTRKHPHGRIALVTHAGVISQLVGFLTGTSPARWERYRVGNTALTELDWERSGGRVVYFDDQHHLHAMNRDQGDSAGTKSTPDSVGPAEHLDPFLRGVRCA